MYNELIEQLTGMMAKDFVNSKKPNIIALKNSVMNATAWCPSDYKMATRLFVIRNGITAVPACVCGSPLKVDKTYEQNGFRKYCGDACAKKYRKSAEVKELIDYDWMYDKRISNKMSYIAIGELLHVSDVCVAAACVKLGIPEVKYNWAESATPEDKQDRNTARIKTQLGEIIYEKLYKTDTIKKMYYDDLLSVGAIAEEFNVSEHAIKTAADSIGLILEQRTYSISKSKRELELFEFVKSIRQTAISGYRPNGYHSKEADIFIPELNIGIDYHGCYIHSDACGKEKNYHKSKLEYFTDLGIRYIQIWSDDWECRKDVVKSFVRNIIDKSNKTVGARKTKVIELTQAQYSRFLDDHHMQGATASGVRLGCVYDGIVVSVMGFSKIASNTEFDGYYLDRFANTNIVGAFSKLLKHFTKEHNVDVYSFADLQTVYRKNNVYTKNGFVEYRIAPPDYKYFNATKTKVRKHKFNFRKANFKALGLVIEGKTEKQLAEEYGLVRCYDSGKILYKLEKM
jgi:predicted DNA-binding protein YlxM (UPF0122 family)